MNNGRIPESGTSLRFCEHCGSPLFDYGNVCTACGKQQSPQNSVPENGYAYNAGASASAPRVSGLKGTALGNKADNRSYNGTMTAGKGYSSDDASYFSGASVPPANNTVPIENNIPLNISDPGWAAPADGTPAIGTAQSMPPAEVHAAKKTERKGSGLVLTFVCFLLFAVCAAVAVILYMNYTKQKDLAESYKAQADSAMAQLRSYESGMQENESKIDDYIRQIEDCKQQIASYERQLSDARDTIAAKDEEIEMYLDDIYELEDWKQDNYMAADFTNKWVVVVFDNGSNIYHKTSCPYFESLYSEYSFWAYNIDAAKSNNSPCSKCN